MTRLEKTVAAPRATPQAPASGADPLCDLRAVAHRGLEALYAPERGLFCHKLAFGDGVGRTIGASYRYSVMVAIGCLRAQQSGVAASGGVDPGALVGSLVENRRRASGPGDLGLLLWAAALEGKALVPAVVEELVSRGAVSAEGEIACGDTMELAWLLAGLSEAGRRMPTSRDLAGMAQAAAQQLLRRFEPSTALFRRAPLSRRRNFLAARAENSITSFACQVYPIHALALFCEVTGADAGLAEAGQCAQRVCSLQGPLGQWYWLYHVERGGVAEEYPVYSVHQYGMAPLALLQLARVGGLSAQGHIRAGLEWVLGRNELGVSMIDPQRRVVWRAIQRRSLWRPARQADAPFGLGLEGRIAASASAFGLAGPGRWLAGSRPLEILRETRPYEVGWLIFSWPELEKLTSPSGDRLAGCKNGGEDAHR